MLDSDSLRSWPRWPGGGRRGEGACATGHVLLLPFLACCLLPVAACCCLLLLAAGCCWLLPAAVCCWLLLAAAACCCLLLPAAAWLLPAACCLSPSLSSSLWLLLLLLQWSSCCCRCGGWLLLLWWCRWCGDGYLLTHVLRSDKSARAPSSPVNGSFLQLLLELRALLYVAVRQHK